MKLKRITVLSFVFLIMACLAFAGGKTEQATSANAGHVNLKWLMFSTEEESFVWKTIAQMASNDKVTVVPEFTSWTDYWDQLLVRLSSGEQVDLLGMQSLRMPTFAERNALLPLDELVASDKYDLTAFFKTMIDGMSSNGKLYGLPWDMGPLMLFYNKTLFDKYNVPYPSSDPSKWTWQTFLDAAMKMTHHSSDQAVADTWGFFAPSEIDRGMYGFILEGGADLQDPTMRKATLNTPQAASAVQFYDDLINKYHVSPPISDTRNMNATGEQWPTGNYAMMQEGTWMIPEFQRTAKNFKWDIALLPAGPAGSQTWVAGSGYSISAKTKYKKEAWEALKAMSSRATGIYIAENRSYPAVKAGVPYFEKKYSNLSLSLIPKQNETGRAFKTRSTFQEAWTMMAPWWDKIFLHQTSVEDGLNQINNVYQKTLDESWK